MSKRLRKKNVIRYIKSAFNGVVLDDGVSLTETHEIDDYRRVLPGSNSRENDELLDWAKLVGSEQLLKYCWVGGLSFFDAKGFRFHIPAYLMTDICTNQLGDIEGTMVRELTMPCKHRIEDFKLFTKAQKNAVFEAMLYLHEFDITSLDKEELMGLYQHWR